MCGRYYLRTLPDALYAQFELPLPPAGAPRMPPRYNIAPTQPVPAVRVGPQGRRELVLLHWGLIPHWAKDPAIGNRMINARAETAAEKPSFRNALKRRRCLIPADGYYEWQSRPGGPKQPYRISRRDEALFAFAGLWEHWQGPNGEEIESCAVLTTEATGELRAVHHRSPVIVERDDYALWLDHRDELSKAHHAMLEPHEQPDLTAVPVSTYVNNARNEGPQCIEPLTEEPDANNGD